MASQEETRKIPLKVLIDKQNNKVVAVETTKDFVDTLFSFLSLPLATITRLLTTTNNNNNDDQTSETESESESPILGNINNLYQSVQNLNPDDVWYPVCKQMLLHPRNPCGALCKKLFLNVDDEVTETKFFVCDSCNRFTQFPNLLCTCGKPPNRQPRNLDSDGQANTSVEGNDGVFVKEKGSMFLVFDDLKIVPSSLLTSMKLLMELGYSDWSQLERQTHNIGKQEVTC